MDQPATLSTCSYTGYRRETMGMPVRITRSAPRFLRLPDPRYGEFTSWPAIPELAPDRSFFKKVTATEFRERYAAQLSSRAIDIDERISYMQSIHGSLVLLCFERDVTDILVCHRRQFAEWWQARTGQEVPEIGDGK